MNKSFKRFSLVFSLLVVILLAACGGDSNGSDNTSEGDDSSSYPEKDINGIIMWGEGGATDIIARTLAPLTEEHIGQSLVMQNRAGAAGAIATQYVYDQPADGYTLLFGAENPNLYQIYDISERNYITDFVPVSIIANSFAGIIVKADSEFETLEDVVDYAKENPGELVFGTTGEGGLPTVVTAMLKNVLDTDFTTVPYDGEGPVTTALLGNEVDISAVTVSAAKEYVESGDFRMLAVVHNEELESFPGVSPITEIYPEFEKLLPWGPFQAVFAHKDTPEEIVQQLTDAFQTAQENEEFQETLNTLGMNPLNINGEEAIEFVKQNQSTATWMLYDAGLAEISPEEFDIPRSE